MTMKKKTQKNTPRNKQRTAVKYKKFPKTLGGLSQGFDALIRELGKR